MPEAMQSWLQAAVEWLRIVVVALSAGVIALGLIVAAAGLVRHLVSPQAHDFSSVRLRLARYLALALELQLAADILATSVAPSWDEIGKLAAIAVIRTALNYFLNQEMKDEEQAARRLS